VLSDVWVREIEQILDKELKLSVHALFSLGMQESVHSFLIFSNIYTLHTQSSVQCYRATGKSSTELASVIIQVCRFQALQNFSKHFLAPYTPTLKRGSVRS
jgi:capsular polysaccharide biosynthesis protein